MELNERPIIGILSQRFIKEPLLDRTPVPNVAEIAAEYVKWIESAGARVVPVLINQSEAYYDKLYKSLNGLVLPGGYQEEDTLLESPSCKVAKYFLERSIQEFDTNGDYFPIWGTCQGSQILAIITAKKLILEKTEGTFQVKFRLHLQEGYQSSRLFDSDNIPTDTLNVLTTQEVTYNSHKWSVTKKIFSSIKDLSNFYRILATNCDGNGVEYITTMEARRYPVYATVWHPEVNSYLWDLDKTRPHSYNAVRISQHLANFFVSEARKSQHKFVSVEEESKSLIYNFSPVSHGNICYGRQHYLFDI